VILLAWSLAGTSTHEPAGASASICRRAGLLQADASMLSRWLAAAPIILCTGALIAACKPSDDKVYTLYRESTVPEIKRVHIATFDADESDDYNRANCETARSLFAAQLGVVVRYWCEKGYYRD
jgi:hypothetical protein